MKPDSNTLQAQRLFESIADELGLDVVTTESYPVELYMKFPTQTRLRAGFSLMLENEDELHFCVGHYRKAYFPMDDPKVLQLFRSHVLGFVAGEYRVLEHFRGQRFKRAELQCRKGLEWTHENGNISIDLLGWFRRGSRLVNEISNA